MPKLKRSMPIKPKPATASPAGRWGSTYDAERGTWEPDKPATPKRR